MLSSFAGMAPTYSSINSTSLHDALPIYRFLGHPSGQVATVVLVEVDGLPGGGGVEVGIEQPQLDLLAQDAAHCGVEHLDLQATVPHGLREMGEGGGLGKFDVHQIGRASRRR